MDEFERDAVEAVRAGLDRQDEPVDVTLSSRAERRRKLLELLEAEGHSGAVVVPVKEQFTTTEAARMLGISRPTLMKLIDAGDISSVKVATHHGFPPLQSGTTSTRAARVENAPRKR